MEKHRTEKISIWKDYVVGLATTLTSPKVMLFYLILIPQFISTAYPPFDQFFILVVTQNIIKLLSLLGYSLMARKAIEFFKSRYCEIKLNKISGGILIIIAVVLLFFY